MGNYGVVNEYSNISYAPSTESHILAQGLPAPGLPNGYLADTFDNPNTLRYDAEASLSAQPHAFSTGALNLTNPTYAGYGYGGVPPAPQYYSNPSNYNERPFATDTVPIGDNIFPTGSTSYNTGQPIANNPVYMPSSNNPFAPLDNGLMTEDSFALSPNKYNTGQASANYPFPMHGSNNPIVPIDIGFTTGGPIALSPNNYTAGRALTNNSLPMATSNNHLIPVDMVSPVRPRRTCKNCNETFRRQSDLERHALKHGPKNIKCQVQGCKYRTYRNDKLREHVGRRHPAAGSRST